MSWLDEEVQAEVNAASASKLATGSTLAEQERDHLHNPPTCRGGDRPMTCTDTSDVAERRTAIDGETCAGTLRIHLPGPKEVMVELGRIPKLLFTVAGGISVGATARS